MTLGMSDRFKILQQSPHDLQSDPPPEPAISEDETIQRWVPSRYNIRAVTEDGRLVIWNSYKGTMSVFGATQRSKIESLLSRRGFSARFEGIVQYLFQRGLLINEGTDEYRRIQLKFGREHYRNDALELILLASEDCNFRCTYCYEDFARGTMKQWVRNGIKKLVERRLSTLRRLSVSWFGGEPLYGFQAIEDLAPFFTEVTTKNSIPFSSNMTTNAYLLTPQVAENLLAWKINSFQITIDGLPEDHDRNRPSRDGQGTFATIMENLQALARRDEQFTVALRFNYDRDNFAKFSDFFDMLARTLNRDPRFQLRFQRVSQLGGANDDQLNVCGIEDSADLERTMRREARKRGLTLKDEISPLSVGYSQVCYAARPYNFLIGATGKLMKCTVDLDKDDRNVVGRITENGELIIDEDKLALWTEPAFENDSQCKKCVVLPVCQGMYCPAVRIHSGESPCTPLRMAGKKDIQELVEGTTPKRQLALDYVASQASVALSSTAETNRSPEVVSGQSVEP